MNCGDTYYGDATVVYIVLALSEINDILYVNVTLKNEQDQDTLIYFANIKFYHSNCSYSQPFH